MSLSVDRAVRTSWPGDRQQAKPSHRFGASTRRILFRVCRDPLRSTTLTQPPPSSLIGDKTGSRSGVPFPRPPWDLEEKDRGKYRGSDHAIMPIIPNERA